MHALTSLLYICYNERIDLFKPIKKYIYGSEKRSFTSYPAAKHPKHSQLSLVFTSWGVTLAPAKTSFEKVSVPFQSSTACTKIFNFK